MWLDELSTQNQHQVRALILAGLAEHWGVLDESLNPDLDDMVSSYSDGHTVLLRADDGSLLGTGTLRPRSEGVAEILRMSVAASARRRGIGRRIVDELVATALSWDVSVVVLETSTAWEDVIQFYLRCGFVTTHTEEGAFGSDTWFERQL